MALIYRASFLCLLAILEVYTSEIPVGHLKPLGSHRPPSTDLIDEVYDWPTPQEFWTKYVKPSRALVLRGAGKHSKAFTEWTDEYMKKNYGDLEVRLEGKKEKSGRIPIGVKGVGRDTIGNYVDNSHRKDGFNSYIVSDLPSPMYKDVAVIPPLTCGTFKDHLVEVDLWLSGGGTSSIMHKDAFNAINCLYNGTKIWKMIEYKYEDKIYKAWEPPEMIGGYSRINVQKVDLLKYPKVAEVPWAQVTINAGDCLFLPKSYYHQVTSSGDNNAAVALLFSRFDHMDDLDFSDCDRELQPTPLSEMDIDWIYSGHGNLTMGNTDVGIVRHSLELLFEGKKKLDKKGLMKIARKQLTEEEKGNKLHYIAYARGHPKLVWDFLKGDEKGYITLDQVENLTRDEMRQFVLMAEGTDVTNTEQHEYGYIDLGELRALLKAMLKRHGHIKQDELLKRYIKMGGTEKYAMELFSKLNSDGDDKVTPEEYKRNAEDALQLYEHWNDARPEERSNPNNPGETQDAYVEDEEQEREQQGDEEDEGMEEPEGEKEQEEPQDNTREEL